MIQRLPSCIATPLIVVTGHFGIRPAAAFAGVCLWNFRQLQPGKGRGDPDNLACLISFTGTEDESWFYMVSVAIEAEGAAAIPWMLEAMAAVHRRDYAVVTSRLQDFARCVRTLVQLLSRMRDNCQPSVFYERIRPLLAGSKNNPALPNGIIYEGNDTRGVERYRKYAGGSNAQSSLIQFFDAVLGITHPRTSFLEVRPLVATNLKWQC